MAEHQHLWSNHAHLRAVEVACRIARNDEREEMRRELAPVVTEMVGTVVTWQEASGQGSDNPMAKVVRAWCDRIEEVLGD